MTDFAWFTKKFGNGIMLVLRPAVLWNGMAWYGMVRYCMTMVLWLRDHDGGLAGLL